MIRIKINNFTMATNLIPSCICLCVDCLDCTLQNELTGWSINIILYSPSSREGEWLVIQKPALTFYNWENSQTE